ncbi:MFS transporter [Streptomyces sp. NPDC059477]|uniref:MFS transporter n=1 Tax=Streptomyces sp. NPDC059477 TaxID=3346847 RepID=UPI0036AC56D5
MPPLPTTALTRIPGFRRLLTGRTLSMLATCLVPTALTLAVIDSTLSAGDLGLVLACELIPQLLLLPIGGVLADRLPPQRVAFAADLVRGLAQLGIGIALLNGSVNLLYLCVLSSVTGVGVAIGTPTVSPLVTAVVPHEARLRANSYLGTTRGIALVAGPGIVGVMVITIGVGWSFVLTAALFLLAATTLGGLKVTRHERPAGHSTFRGDLAEGWQVVRSHRWFWTNLVGHGVSNLTAGVLATLGPLIAVRELGGDTSWVITYQCGMVGMLLGAYLAPRLPISRPLVATSLGGAAFALPLLTFAVPAPTAVNSAAYFVAMLGLGVLNTVWQTVIQQRFEPHTLARADSYDALLSFAARPLGLALAAPVAATTGNAAVLVVAAVLVGAGSLGLLALREVRTMRFVTPEETAPETVPAAAKTADSS